MASIQPVLEHIKKWEGGYANVQGDRGGETYIGIARNAHPNWDGWEIIDAHKPLKHNAKIADAELDSLWEKFVKDIFWNPMFGDSYNSQQVANFIFDMWWGSGFSGLKLANQIANTLTGKKIAKYSRETVAALNSLDEAKLLNALYTARKRFLETIVAKNPSQGKFLKGWLNRLNDVMGGAITVIKTNPGTTGLSLLLLFGIGMFAAYGRK